MDAGVQLHEQKLLADHRDWYIEQSRNTKNGVIPELPVTPAELNESEQKAA